MALVGDIIIGNIARTGCHAGWTYSLDSTLQALGAPPSGETFSREAARLFVEQGWGSWLLTREFSA